MKKFFIFGLTALTLTCSQSFAQTDSTGMPGDNFDLEGALFLFKQATSLEDFEKQLNTESNKVNNLDLDQDGKTDYIRVIDNQNNGYHAIQLQIPISSTENQDIAAILIESEASGNAKLQMVGDSSLYGEEKIIEPLDEKEIKKSTGPSSLINSTIFVYVNVWHWPCVTYLYRPTYVVWVSPFYWGYYPMWWRPWRPMYYHAYYGHMRHYHGWCNYTRVYYVHNAHRVYAGCYKQSPTIYRKYTPQRQNYATRNNATKSAGVPVRTKSGVANEKVGSSRNPAPRGDKARPNTTPNRTANPTGPRTPQTKPVTPTRSPQTRPTTPTRNNGTINQPRQQQPRKPAAPRSTPRPAPARGGRR